MKVTITSKGIHNYPVLMLGIKYEALIGLDGFAYILDENKSFWYMAREDYEVVPEKVYVTPEVQEEKPLSEVLKGYSKVTLEI